jgi:predicted O-methyltransferase YrrM
MPDPSNIIALATAHWASMVLLTANRLNLFTLLSGAPRSPADVAAKCGAHPRPLTMLLNACVGQGLLRRENGCYVNSETAEAFLTPGKPGYLGDALRYSDDLYPVWGRLGEAIASNAPVLRPETILGADSEKTRNFVLGMHNRARGAAATLASILDLRGRQRLLDVGGGPGTYSILLIAQTPGLTATVLDLPAVVGIGQELIAEAGYADRVRTLAGDYTTTEFPADHDTVLMSGILHRETPESSRRLLGKAFAALPHGGLIVLSDVFFEDDAKDRPPFATLFALNMLLTSEHGGAHAKTEMSRWMSQSGFVDIRVKPLPPPMPHTVLLGTKP